MINTGITTTVKKGGIIKVKSIYEEYTPLKMTVKEWRQKTKSRQ